MEVSIPDTEKLYKSESGTLGHLSKPQNATKCEVTVQPLSVPGCAHRGPPLCIV